MWQQFGELPAWVAVLLACGLAAALTALNAPPEGNGALLALVPFVLYLAARRRGDGGDITATLLAVAVPVGLLVGFIGWDLIFQLVGALVAVGAVWYRHDRSPPDDHGSASPRVAPGR